MTRRDSFRTNLMMMLEDKILQSLSQRIDRPSFISRASSTLNQQKSQFQSRGQVVHSPSEIQFTEN